jgi:hypothetical protein
MLVRLAGGIIESVVKLIPDSWLDSSSNGREQRDVYAEYLGKRLEPPHTFVEEAIRARSLHL